MPTKYKDTVSDMNSMYSRLLHFQLIKDTRVEYLRTFESTLGLNLPEPLIKNPRYLRVTARWPLPERGYTTERKYRAYMLLYEEIMRDAGLLERHLDGDGSDMDEGAFSRWRSTAISSRPSSAACSGRGRCWSPTA
ncbi:MAG: hypothetical protein IKP53_08115 [Candidatus Methanomethylophilaceae archaeon]|nr:hypothetical protein [Candidatus Methanomethylophilaceae archaeon]